MSPSVKKPRPATRKRPDPAAKKSVVKKATVKKAAAKKPPVKKKKLKKPNRRDRMNVVLVTAALIFIAAASFLSIRYIEPLVREPLTRQFLGNKNVTAAVPVQAEDPEPPLVDSLPPRAPELAPVAEASAPAKETAPAPVAQAPVRPAPAAPKADPSPSAAPASAPPPVRSAPVASAPPPVRSVPAPAASAPATAVPKAAVPPAPAPPAPAPRAAQPAAEVRTAVSLPPAAVPERPIPEKRGTLAFIIDDAGNNLRDLEPFLKIPMPLTIAVLPGLPNSAEAARRIRAAGKEVFLHQPMEALGGTNPGPGAIRAGMSRDEIRAIVRANLDEIGPVAGINNHEGSRITMDEEAMEAVLALCQERGILFVDSRTTAETAAPRIARRLGINIGERDIFIDNTPERESMIGYINAGLQKAEQNGSAIMIGHTWTAGLAPLLSELFPDLRERGYSFSPASKLVSF